MIQYTVVQFSYNEWELEFGSFNTIDEAIAKIENIARDRLKSSGIQKPESIGGLEIIVTGWKQ